VFRPFRRTGAVPHPTKSGLKEQSARGASAAGCGTPDSPSSFGFGVGGFVQNVADGVAYTGVPPRAGLNGNM
jgi:hypothetical protein